MTQKIVIIQVNNKELCFIQDGDKVPNIDVIINSKSYVYYR